MDTEFNITISKNQIEIGRLALPVACYVEMLMKNGKLCSLGPSFTRIADVSTG